MNLPHYGVVEVRVVKEGLVHTTPGEFISMVTPTVHTNRPFA